MKSTEVLGAKSRERFVGQGVYIGRNPPIDKYYGYGWYVHHRDGVRYRVRHFGDDDWLGNSAAIWIYEDGDTIIVLSHAGVTDESRPWAIEVSAGLDSRLRGDQPHSP